MTQRSYRATYKQYGDRYGMTFRDLIAPDSFLDAVEMAESMRGDGELLVNLRSADELDAIVTVNRT
jgi:hypothetical protein